MKVACNINITGQLNVIESLNRALFVVSMLAFLICNRAACFASRLAGSLALAASAVCNRFFQI